LNSAADRFARIGERALKPSPFKYAAPSTIDEALALFGRAGGDAKLLAGGQSLVPMMNLRLATPAAIIDLNRIANLSRIAVGAAEIRIGAMTRHRAIETSAELRAALPILPRAAAEIGHLAIRNRGTIGGSIAHADPAAEWPLAGVALDASMVMRSVRGERAVSAREFFIAPMTTALAEDEILTEIRFPRVKGQVGYGFAEMCRRHGDFALASALARAVHNEAGKLTSIELAIGGAHPVPFLVPGLDRLAVNTAADSLRDAAAMASRAVEPSSDIHGSADFRRRITATVAYRALAECLEVGEGARAHV
jgi:aerobic carbon-monoxide dehydrogenase medium subunit